MNIAGFDLTLGRLLIGVFTGLGYGLLAVGLVLVYRASRFINFAHAAIGVFGSAVLGRLVAQSGVPYWLAFPIAILAGAAIAGLVEVGFIRRLSSAPRVLGTVVTLGLAQFLVLAGLILNSKNATGQLYPKPPGFSDVKVGTTTILSANVALAVFTPIVLILLLWFLKRTRYGLAIRAAADNPDAASLAGVKAGRMVTLSWAIAGGIATFSAILVAPTLNLPIPETFGPSLLIYGLAGAVLARFSNLLIAFFASLGIGVISVVLQSNTSNQAFSGSSELAVAIIVVIGLLLQPRLSTRRDEDRGEWSRLMPAALPSAYRKVIAIRAIVPICVAILFAVLIYVAFTSTNKFASTMTIVVGFTIVGLSVIIVTGIAGQLSLGQFAFAAIAGAVSVRLTADTGSYWVGLLAGLAAAALAAVLIGIPALRLRGLALAVSTLAFSFATAAWLLPKDFLVGNGIRVGKPVLPGLNLSLAKDYYLFSLVFLVLALFLTWNIRRSGFGRIARALRDNEDAARAFTVAASRRKLQTYAVSGLIAGLGGIVIAHSYTILTKETFAATDGIDAVTFTAFGGLGTLFGPLAGAAYFKIPVSQGFLGDFGPPLLILASVIFIVTAPRGLVGLFVRLRNKVADGLARMRGIDPTEARAADEGSAADRMIRSVDLAPLVRMRETAPPAFAGKPGPDVPEILRVEGMSKSFGGVKAVQDVSFGVRQNEILGIIGPNGAGKTTMFEMIAGFTALDAGTVTFDGEDITKMSPEERARRGVVRSFQAARLYPTMSVFETVLVAQERVKPTNVGAALTGFSRVEKRKAERAKEFVDVMGLTSLMYKPVGELSTGTRRMVEITSMLALEPKVLLLDEPAGGIAQSEGDALVQIFNAVRTELGTTLVVIEHDLPLLFRLADRLVAMELGKIIATGDPLEVRDHPDVVRSYLGADAVAVERSGPFVESEA